MSDESRTTTRRSILAATSATLLGTTAGCLGESDNIARAPAPESQETFVPSTLDVPGSHPTSVPPEWSGTPATGTATPSGTATQTGEATATGTSAQSPGAETATRTETATATDRPDGSSPPTATATATPETPSDFTHPYLSAGSGSAPLGIDRARYPVMGAPEAPVEILYWSDYLCTFCSTFSLDVHPTLIEQYVAPGTVRFVFLPFPFKGDNSQPAAMLAGAIWQTVKSSSPSSFWDWHHRVFEHQRKPDSGWASVEKLSQHASAVGIDMRAVERTYNHNTQALWKDIQAAKKAARKEWNPPGTPIFYVYNRETNAATKVTGTQPVASFEAAIADVQ